MYTHTVSILIVLIYKLWKKELHTLTAEIESEQVACIKKPEAATRMKSYKFMQTHIKLHIMLIIMCQNRHSEEVEGKNVGCSVERMQTAKKCRNFCFGFFFALFGRCNSWAGEKKRIFILQRKKSQFSVKWHTMCVVTIMWPGFSVSKTKNQIVDFHLYQIYAKCLNIIFFSPLQHLQWRLFDMSPFFLSPCVRKWT